jgi:hypothetical protein
MPVRDSTSQKGQGFCRLTIVSGFCEPIAELNNKWVGFIIIHLFM